MADQGSNTSQSAVAQSSVSSELEYMDTRLSRAGELSTEIVGTLNVQLESKPVAVPEEPRVTELDTRMGRVRDQVGALNKIIEQLEYIAEEVHKV